MELRLMSTETTRSMNRRLHRRRGTIRSRILVAFLAIGMITATLGAYAIYGIRNAGTLVTKTFDETLMSINYARAAAADFAAIQAAFLRRETSKDEKARAALDDQIEKLIDTLNDDLAVAAERSHSKRATEAAGNVKEAAATWSKLRTKLHESAGSPDAWIEIDKYADTVNQQIDLLVNYTAGDGFLYRQEALETVARDVRLNMIGTALALLLAAIVSWLLAQRIIGPVAAASQVAKRIAGGDLDVTIPVGARDELGALLESMGTMRDNIRAMVEREISERRSAQTQLAESLESSREGIILLGPNGQLRLANSQAIDYLREDRELLDHITSAFGTDEARLPDGRWLRVSNNRTHDGGSIVMFGDITALKEQKAQLRETNLRLDAALDNMSQGLCFFDHENRLQVVNRRYCEIFNLSPQLIRPGISYNDMLMLSVAAGNYGGRTLDQIVEDRESHLRSGEAGPYFQELADGRVISIAQQTTSNGGWVATYEDVTEQRRAESRIAFMARHDALTDLPNRLLFRERVEHALAQSNRGRGFAVLCVGLDKFKAINETLGHAVGDKLLVAVAARMRGCVREIDTIARLGGDEFAVVQIQIGYPEDAALLSRRIINAVSEPFEIEGHRITIGCSVGISIAPGDGTSSEKLIKGADVALYRAKSEGRGTWRFFEAEMDARLQARRAIELDLRNALDNGEFEVFHQPIFDLDKNRFSGCEALVRWRHPVNGLISPDSFITIAEDIGEITRLGEWVLRRACEDASRWPSGMKVAVNVSPIQFRDTGLVQAVRNALTASGLPAQRLELEITESVLLANNSTTLTTLHELRALGVRIALDDFGTGYSSLSYLRSFPFDKIKIDRSFVRDLSAAEGSKMIVRAIINLSKNLGMVTTAEGVETNEQLELVRSEGCDEVQGYLFGRPMPVDALPEAFNATRKSKKPPILRAV